MPRFHHLTDDERRTVDHGLKERLSLRKIATLIGKHPATVAREIKARRRPSDKSAQGRIPNRCVHRPACDKIQLCMDRPNCLRKCASCTLCNTRCKQFAEHHCAKLKKSPYVCNGCPDEARCVLRKMYYIHTPAHKNYREILVETRKGANITEAELLAIDTVLTPASLKGKSIHHTMVNHPDRFTVCERTVYRYTNARLLTAKRGDMPRMCRLKPRKRKSLEHKVDTKCRLGRTYEDFLRFIADNPGANIVEMDTVHGRVGGKVLLTLKDRRSGLLLAVLLEHNDSQSVIDAFTHLWDIFGETLFRDVFFVILTDNGSEFSNPCALETAPDGTPRARVFYCDPCRSDQKGAIEREHSEFRRILPKGSTFDPLAQADINLVLCHTNSYTRPGLGDKSPYDLFAFLHGVEVLECLGLRRIPADDIILKPSLLAHTL
jgi:IS30 family transposase